MSTDVDQRRPAIVTVALVFVYFSGLSNAALGILVLLSRYEAAPDDVLPVSLLGSGIILFGLLTLAVASAIGRGSRLARLATTAYLVVQFALHVWALFGTDWDWTIAIFMAVDVFVIAALWVPPGARHFLRAR